MRYVSACIGLCAPSPAYSVLGTPFLSEPASSRSSACRMAKRNGAPVDMHRSAWGALAVAVCMSVLPHAAMARTPLVQLDMSADSGDVATRADSGAASGLEQPHELRQVCIQCAPVYACVR